MSEKITVLGDGGWGTALSLLLHEKGCRTVLWGAFPEYLALTRDKRENVKFLPGVSLPADLLIEEDLDTALAGASMCVLAVPSHAVREVCARMKSVFPPGCIPVSASKGIENRTLLRMSEVMTEVVSCPSVVALSGPSHAEEVAKHIPTTIVAASRDMEAAKRVQKAFMSERFRVYTNLDLIGVELGGALKNIIAIAAGICDGLGFGANTKAALITRGLAEIRRLGVAMGALPETFAGLSGIGDLVTTCISPFGRNRKLGLLLAEGMSVQEALDSSEMVVEGVRTALSAHDLAKKHSVEMPITREIYAVLYEDKKPKAAVRDLMLRKPRHETEHWGE